MRTQHGTRAALALIGLVAGIGLLLAVLGGGGSGEGPAPVARGSGSAGGPGPAIADPTDAGSDAAVREPAATDPVADLFDETEPAGVVDVFVLGPTGEGLLRAVPPQIPPALEIWVKVALVPSGTSPGELVHGATFLPPQRGRVRTGGGWVTSFQAAAEPRFLALMLGTAAVAVVPVPPGSGNAKLVLDPAQIEGSAATVRGRLAGFVDAPKFVKVRPLRGGKAFLAPIRATGAGDTFEVAGIPPGQAAVFVRLDPGVFAQTPRRTDGTSGVIVQGARRVSSEGQWNGRIETLSRAPLPLHVVRLELAPGEVHDLGLIEPESAGVLLLELVDAAGEPVKSTGVGVLPLGAPSQPLDQPRPTTFENRAMVHPLPVRTLEYFVRSGDSGAIQPMAAGVPGGAEPLVTHRVEMQRLSVVVLPGEDTQLLTESGAHIRADPRWTGADFLGERVGPNVRLVPPGHYVLDRIDGTPRTFVVEPGTRVDFETGVPLTTDLRR